MGATSPLCHHNNNQHASSYLPTPPPHLKGSNVPSSASAWQDPQGSQPRVGVPGGLRVSNGGLPASPVQLCAQRGNLKAEWRLFPLKCKTDGVLTVTFLHSQ